MNLKKIYIFPVVQELKNPLSFKFYILTYSLFSFLLKMLPLYKTIAEGNPSAMVFYKEKQH